MAGISSIYGSRTNPHERRARVAGDIMGSSGLARPFVAAVMGGEMKKAGAWDEEQSGKLAARETLKSIINLSKVDAKAATQLLAREAAQNSYLKPYKDIKFRTETTKDYWATVTDGEGQPFQLYIPGLGKKNKDGTPLSFKDMVANGTAIKIGAPKPDKKGEVAGTTKEARQWHSNALSALKNFYGKITDYGFVLNPDASEEFEYAMTALEKYRGQGLDANQAAVKAKEEARQALLKKRLPGTLADMPEPTPGQLDMLKTPGGGAPGLPGTGQPLDEATAAQILKEAGGDVNKAREIARQRGFTF